MVARFNHEGIAAVMPRHGGGRRRTYSDAHRARILAAVCRVAVRAGPRGWSVATVQRALREDGDDRLRTVSHPVVRQVLRAAGWQWDRAPGWNPQPAAPGSRSDPSAIPAGARTDVGGAEP